MDVPATIREARRFAGLSQRAFAARLGQAPTTVAGWESGRRTPPLSTLIQILDLCGRALVAETKPADPSPELIGHLRLSLTSRLRLALGERFSPYARARGEPWLALLALGRCGTVVLEPPVATGIWIPVAPSTVVRVTMHLAKRELPELPGAEVTLSSDAPGPSLVPVTVEGPVRVWVPPPAELLSAERMQLRQAAGLLSAGPSRDDAGRRSPAHRDPDEWREAARLLRSKGTEQLERPLPELGRAWRLGAPVSLSQAVRARPHLF